MTPKVYFISCLKAKKLISKGYIYDVIWVEDTKSKTPTLDDAQTIPFEM